MHLAYIIPTRDRPQVLERTLEQLGSLPPHAAQAIVVDNASAEPQDVPHRLANGIIVECIRLQKNHGAAARNIAAMVSDPACDWLVMLDDDSAPLNAGHLAALRDAAPGTGAVAAEILLESPAGARVRMRESGGLPEVFIGCGVAVRRSLYLELGGYDPLFGYYAEEYDLAARMLLAGYSVALDRRFLVEHRKVAAGRDMDLIFGRLMRNNGWVMQRYAPARRRIGELSHIIERYTTIARKEWAERGAALGRAELARTLCEQRRSPLPGDLWRRFTGEAEAMRSLSAAYQHRPFRTAAIVHEGKNANIIRRALGDIGVREVSADAAPEVQIIGTLSPGPLLDAWDTQRTLPGLRLISPWQDLTGSEPAARAAHAA